jgi:DNA-binding transcriptional MerR regulator
LTVKISQLAMQSGYSVSTIKYYIRAGLLPPGRATQKNQALYDDAHQKRLRLISVLQDELHMSVAQMKDVLTSPRRRRPEVKADSTDKSNERAEREVMALARDMGWLLDRNENEVRATIAAVATIQRVTPEARPGEYLARFGELTVELARQEIPERQESPDAGGEEEEKVLDTLLYEPLLLSLRRIARGQRLSQVDEMSASGRRHKQP